MGRYDALIRHCMSNLDRTTLNWRIQSINYHKGRCVSGRIGDRIIILMATLISPPYDLYLRMKNLKLVSLVTLL